MRPRHHYTETPHVEMGSASEVGSQAVVSHQSVDGPEVISKETSAKGPNADTTEDHLPWYKEVNMLKRIGAIVAVVVLGYFAYHGFSRYKTSRDMAAGEVVSDDGNQPAPSPETDSAKPGHGAPTPSISSAIKVLGLPKTDTLAPNPSNGQAFGGTGKFQVYRQGNITWRVNTESGESCILLATQEEWRKSIVYSHGCNDN